MAENIILIDEEDNKIGVIEKLEAHKLGKLHRAFSIFVFNTKGEMLIQQRAKEKYHCGGLWTNTCCSHPRPDEITEEAVHRRLKEEMGFDCVLREAFKFTYYSRFENGLTEYETDHVFVGISDTEPVINKEEAMDYRWTGMRELLEDMEKNGENYTPWFRIAIEKMREKELRPIADERQKL